MKKTIIIAFLFLSSSSFAHPTISPWEPLDGPSTPETQNAMIKVFKTSTDFLKIDRIEIQKNQNGTMTILLYFQSDEAREDYIGHNSMGTKNILKHSAISYTGFLEGLSDVFISLFFDALGPLSERPAPYQNADTLYEWFVHCFRDIFYFVQSFYPVYPGTRYYPFDLHLRSYFDERIRQLSPRFQNLRREGLQGDFSNSELYF
jgi:hypothetical protein